MKSNEKGRGPHTIYLGAGCLTASGVQNPTLTPKLLIYMRLRPLWVKFMGKVEKWHEYSLSWGVPHTPTAVFIMVKYIL